MNHKTATIIMLIVYGIDCIVLTPFIVAKGLGQEAGLVLSRGYDWLGLSFFYLWFFVFGIFLFFTLKFLFWYFDFLLKKNSKYPKWALVITWVILMIGTIIHNLQFLRWQM